MFNVLDALNKREQAKVKLMYAESQEEAVKERNKFEGLGRTLRPYKAWRARGASDRLLRFFQGALETSENFERGGVTFLQSAVTHGSLQAF